MGRDLQKAEETVIAKKKKEHRLNSVDCGKNGTNLCIQPRIDKRMYRAVKTASSPRTSAALKMVFSATQPYLSGLGHSFIGSGMSSSSGTNSVSIGW